MIYWILVGLVAGWLTGKIMKGSGYGVIGDIILGILGGFLGGFILSTLGIGGGGLIWSILVAVFGAVLLVAFVRLIKRA
jgi:uncharacterized membrane protein YeaQ/YmgE (transglycosylase-associated protein family)